MSLVGGFLKLSGGGSLARIATEAKSEVQTVFIRPRFDTVPVRCGSENVVELPSGRMLEFGVVPESVAPTPEAIRSKAIDLETLGVRFGPIVPSIHRAKGNTTNDLPIEIIVPDWLRAYPDIMEEYLGIWKTRIRFTYMRELEGGGRAFLKFGDQEVLRRWVERDTRELLAWAAERVSLRQREEEAGACFEDPAIIEEYRRLTGVEGNNTGFFKEPELAGKKGKSPIKRVQQAAAREASGSSHAEDEAATDLQALAKRCLNEVVNERTYENVKSAARGPVRQAGFTDVESNVTRIANLKLLTVFAATQAFLQSVFYFLQTQGEGRLCPEGYVFNPAVKCLGVVDSTPSYEAFLRYLENEITEKGLFGNVVDIIPSFVVLRMAIVGDMARSDGVLLKFANDLARQHPVVKEDIFFLRTIFCRSQQ